jgi:5-formyltetrahydrofolate cyclo-ligase
MNPVEAKQAAREAARARVGAMSPVERATASAEVRRHLAASDTWVGAGVVMLFAADETEPDLDALIDLGTASGKTVCVPRIAWESKRLVPAAVADAAELGVGRYGIRVPRATAREVPPELVELVVVPGVVFDRVGGRVGRGGGFYDRFLAERSALGPMPVVTIGACFATQVVGAVPGWDHDRSVDGLVTETGLVMVQRDTEGPG